MTTITPETITFSMSGYFPNETETHTFQTGTPCIYCAQQFDIADYSRAVAMVSARGPICAGCVMRGDRHGTGIAIG